MKKFIRVGAHWKQCQVYKWVYKVLNCFNCGNMFKEIVKIEMYNFNRKWISVKLSFSVIILEMWWIWNLYYLVNINIFVWLFNIWNEKGLKNVTSSIIVFFYNLLPFQANNRFKVPVGTKFYRVKARRWTRESSQSPVKKSDTASSSSWPVLHLTTFSLEHCQFYASCLFRQIWLKF